MTIADSYYKDRVPTRCPTCHTQKSLGYQVRSDLRQRFICNSCHAVFDLIWHHMQNDRVLLILAQINPHVLEALAQEASSDVSALQTTFHTLATSNLYTEYTVVAVVPPRPASY